MSDKSQTTEPLSEDEWWETVSEEQEMRAVLLGCERQCFTFACRCRREAIARVANITGVNYDHPV